jgi:hypothetical protein
MNRDAGGIGIDHHRNVRYGDGTSFAELRPHRGRDHQRQRHHSG